MQPGGKIIGTAAILSLAACSGEQGKLQIRASATPLATGHQAVPFRIAEARGHFAMGNVALALEAFRKALREDPGSVDAMTGVAACYDRMARFDLSRRHYESALAIAPRDPQLLAAFAASLDLQGRKAEAASVRTEINQRVAMAARKSPPQPAPAPALRPGAIEAAATRPADRAVPAPALRPDTVEIAATRPATRAVPAKAVPPMPRKASAERPPTPLPMQEVAAKPVRAAEAGSAPTPAPRPTVTAATARSVTLALPPAQPVVAALPEKQPVKTVAAPTPSPTLPITPPPAKVAVRSVALAAPARPVAAPAPAAPGIDTEVSVARPQAAPVAAAAILPVTRSPEKVARAEPEAAPDPVEKTGPRLERTSLREVALITTAAPQWRALTVKRTQRSATVRFVPLRQASINLSNIRLLNAARVNRLAARTRSYLIGRGWSPMAIGDAPAVRTRSVIFYPPERRRTAQILSAQFGFVMKPRPGNRQITVLLGRDAARVSALRASG